MNLNMKAFNVQSEDEFEQGTEKKKDVQQSSNGFAMQLSQQYYNLQICNFPGTALVALIFVSLHFILFVSLAYNSLCYCVRYLSIFICTGRKNIYVQESQRNCQLMLILSNSGHSLPLTVTQTRRTCSLHIGYFTHPVKATGQCLCNFYFFFIFFHLKLRVRARANLEFKLTAKCFLEYCR